jgi:hypothetical protein
MVSQQHKPQCCFLFSQSKFVTTVQCRFRTTFGEDPPDKKSVTRWYDDLLNKGCNCRGKSSGRPAPSKDNVYGPFFPERTVTGMTYLDTLELWLWPLAEERFSWPFTFLTGWSTTVLSFGREKVSGWAAARNLDRERGTDSLTKDVKDYVYTPPVPHSLAELRDRVSNASARVDAATLQRYWKGKNMEPFSTCIKLFHCNCFGK